MTVPEMINATGICKCTINQRLSALNRTKGYKFRKDYPEFFLHEVVKKENFKMIDGILYHVDDLKITGVKEYEYELKVK